LRSGSCFVPYRGSRVIYSCLALPDFFSQYRGRRVLFSCYARPDSFWAVLRASGPVFMFCTLRLIFDGTEGVGPRCHVLRCRTHFRWYRGRQVQFSFFALLGSFWAVARVLGPVFIFCAFRLVFDGTVFMFCDTRLIWGGTKCVGSRFHGMRSRT
jgi:hypothetical protein